MTENKITILKADELQFMIMLIHQNKWTPSEWETKLKPFVIKLEKMVQETRKNEEDVRVKMSEV